MLLLVTMEGCTVTVVVQVCLLAASPELPNAETLTSKFLLPTEAQTDFKFLVIAGEDPGSIPSTYMVIHNHL